MWTKLNWANIPSNTTFDSCYEELALLVVIFELCHRLILQAFILMCRIPDVFIQNSIFCWGFLMTVHLIIDASCLWVIFAELHITSSKQSKMEVHSQYLKSYILQIRLIIVLRHISFPFNRGASIANPIEIDILKDFVYEMCALNKLAFAIYYVLMSWPSREIYFHLLNCWIFSVQFSCHFEYKSKYPNYYFMNNAMYYEWIMKNK